MNPNGCANFSRVWEFRVPGDHRTWITWSVGYDEPRPVAGAVLAWFAECNPRPDLSLAPAVFLPRPGAIALAKLLRRIRRRDGLTVLHDRTYGGSRPMRPACDCRSIRSLAAKLGISRRQASKYAGYSDYDGRSDRSAGIIGPASS
jgi:hypothetical protein